MHGASERESEAYWKYVELLSEWQQSRPTPQQFCGSLRDLGDILADKCSRFKGNKRPGGGGTAPPAAIQLIEIIAIFLLHWEEILLP